MLTKGAIIMKTYFYLIALVACMFPIVGSIAEEIQPVIPIAQELKKRMPEWMPKIVKHYESGSPELVIFYEEDENEVLQPVKRIRFYEDSKPHEETDLIHVAEGSPAHQKYSTTIVPHGVSMHFSPQGSIKEVLYFDRGLLHGTCMKYYLNGDIHSSMVYNQGERNGEAVRFYENGKKAEECTYRSDKLEGEYISYFQNGNQEKIIPHTNGKPHGRAVHFYENRQIRHYFNFVEGELQSGHETPAIMTYDEEGNLYETQNFQCGKPSGSYIKYHKNGRESYHAEYVDGKIHGIEYFYSPDGLVIGKGRYEMGKRFGKHWRNHIDGSIAFLAEYDSYGHLTQPIVEFDQKGSKISEYSIVEDKLDGNIKKWSENGVLLIDCRYNNGQFDGTQKEYYPSGQLKFSAQYKNGVKNGEIAEWFEDGSLSFYANFKENIQEGDAIENYRSGSPKNRSFYKNGKLHGAYQEWYPNGTLKVDTCYIDGKREGQHRIWNEVNQLLLEVSYKNDLPVGIMHSYYDNGQLKERGEFAEDGKRHGLYEEFYENGVLKLCLHYKDNNVHGKVQGWYEDKSLAYLRHFENGVPVGEQIEYHRFTGNPSRISYFNSDGHMDGEQRTFYENGNCSTIITYKDGTLHGHKARWDEHGNLREESFYENGKLEGRFFERDNEGREVYLHYHKNKKNGLYEIYYPYTPEEEKVCALRGTFKSNKLEGKVIEYNEAGMIVSETQYENGVKSDISTLFDGKGNKVIEIHFAKDKRHGPATYFFPNGKIYKQATFVDDKKEGKETTYDIQGKILSVYCYHNDKLHGFSQHWNNKGVLIFEGEYFDGMKHGIFNKYYEDGTPYVLQFFQMDQLHGTKQMYDKFGQVTEFRYNNGEKLQ